jgi:hypothetical protein
LRIWLKFGQQGEGGHVPPQTEPFEMSNPFGPATSGTSAASAQSNPATARYRKPRIHIIAGIVSALAGAAILVYGAQYFLFHPPTPTDEFVGGRMWVAGSWLLGGGVTLTFARPWVAALVGFFSPAFTFALAMVLYVVLIVLSAVIS